MMISAEVSAHQFKAADFILEKVKTVAQKSSNSYLSSEDKHSVTIISSPMLLVAIDVPLQPDARFILV